MKNRMTVLDVCAVVKNLRSNILGMRVANVYDLNPKTYTLKLAQGEKKVLLLMESGIRLHPTDFSREKSDTPSGFTLKIRKHIRTRRVEDVRQLGVDRVVDFQFGSGDAANHLILEMYSGGNLILTDADYNILTLLRVHTDDKMKLAVHERYPLEIMRQHEPIKEERLLELLTAAKPTDIVKQVLVQALEYGAALVDHCLLSGGVGLKVKVSEIDISPGSAHIQALTAAFAEADGIMTSVSDHEYRGIIVQKPGKSIDDSEAPLLYDEFVPFVLKQYEDKPLLEFPTFAAAVDEFFSKLESQKLEIARHQQEAAAVKKLDRVREDVQQRIGALQSAQDQQLTFAELLEYNLQDVDNAILVIRSLVATGMNWGEIKNVVKMEKKKNNPVAELIHSLNLEQNQITLLLSFNLDNASEEDITAPLQKVSVDISLNAQKNAQQYYSTKKKSYAKQEKTIQASESALKAAEKKAKEELKKVRITASIQQIRKPMFFEKFLWFITSENFLVLAGRDAQQNEILVRRHLKKGDVYVHADLHGASSCIIKNISPDAPIPPLSLAQAGCMTVCRSAAWDAKIITSAYWVHHHQVSKTAPSGEYLSTGSFMIRGKKNYLPPNPLVMGLAIMFKVDESCVAMHFGERKIRGLADDTASVADSEEGAPLRVDDAEAIAQKLRKVEKGKGHQQQQKEGPAVPDTAAAAGGSANENDDEEEEEEGGDDDEEGGNHGSEDSEEGKGGGGDVDDDDESQDRVAAIEKRLQEEDAGASADRGAGVVHMGGERMRVGMELFDDDDDDDEEEEDENPRDQVQHKHMSAAQRRALKKKAAGGGGDDESEAPPQPGPLTQPKPAPQPKPQAQAPQAPQVRGKKGKQKKIKAQYAEQDEEERELAMKLLSSAGSTQMKKSQKKAAAKSAANKPNRPASAPAARGGKGVANQAPKSCWHCGQHNHLSSECPDKNKSAAAASEAPPPLAEGGAEAQVGDQGDALVAATAGIEIEGPEDADDQNDETAAAEAKRMGRKEKREAKQREEEEIRQLMAEENIVELGDEDREKLTELDSLTGTPLPTDILHFAIPVCAPYTAVHNFAYKVKLTPGPQKKGKAAKTALAVFLANTPGSGGGASAARERDLIKNIPDAEMFAAMVGGVKVSAPGVQNVGRKNKQKKK